MRFFSKSSQIAWKRVFNRSLTLSLLLMDWQLALASLTHQANRGEPPWFDSIDLTPYWSEKEATKSLGRPALAAKLSSFQVTDQNGNLFTENSIRGKIAIVSFFFTQCSNICPSLVHSIQGCQRKIKAKGLSNKISFLSFSIMPEHDTPEELKTYAKSRRLDLSNWKLLTGDQTVIYRLGKTIFKADRAVGSQKDKNSFLHSDSLYLIDHQGRIRGIYAGNKADEIDFLVHDIESLSKFE